MSVAGGSVNIETNKITVLPKNRENLQIANNILTKLQAIGLKAELKNFSLRAQGLNVLGMPAYLYGIVISVTADMPHRLITDILLSYGLVQTIPEIALSCAEKEFKIASDTKAESTTMKKDFIEDFVEPYIESILEKCEECKDRNAAFSILALAVVESSDNNYLAQQINRYLTGNRSISVQPTRVKEIIECLRTLEKVCRRDGSLHATFKRLGGFLPTEEKIRESYLKQVEKQLDAKFGPAKSSSNSEVEVEELRRDYIRKVLFLKGHTYAAGCRNPNLFSKLYKEANTKFPLPDKNKSQTAPVVSTAVDSTTDKGDAKNVSNSAPSTAPSSTAVAPAQAFFSSSGDQKPSASVAAKDKSGEEKSATATIVEDSSKQAPKVVSSTVAKLQLQ